RRAPEGARRRSPKRIPSELVLRGDREQVARALEIADQRAERGAGVLDVAVVDPEVGVAAFEFPVVGLIAEAEREPGTAAIRNARRARRIASRRLVVRHAGAQSPFVFEEV